MRMTLRGLWSAVWQSLIVGIIFGLGLGLFSLVIGSLLEFDNLLLKGSVFGFVMGLFVGFFMAMVVSLAENVFSGKATLFRAFFPKQANS